MALYGRRALRLNREASGGAILFNMAADRLGSCGCEVESGGLRAVMCEGRRDWNIFLFFSS